MLETVMQLLGTLAAVVFVIILAYWGTMWFSKRYKTFSSGKQIQVIERIMLSQDKMLILTKVKDEVYFLGITGQQIATIAQFDAAIFPQPEAGEGVSDFAALFKDKLLGQFSPNKKKNDKGDGKGQ